MRRVNYAISDNGVMKRTIPGTERRFLVGNIPRDGISAFISGKPTWQGVCIFTVSVAFANIRNVFN